MCYPLPGPRCATDARKILARAEAVFAADPSDENKKAVEDARKEFLLTEGGRKEMAANGSSEEEVEANRVEYERRKDLYYDLHPEKESSRRARARGKEPVEAPREAEETMTEAERAAKVAAAREAIQRRVNDPEFTSRLARRDDLIVESKRLLAEAKELEEKVANGEADFQEVREKNDEYARARRELIIVKDDLDKYKDKTAEHAVVLSQLQQNYDAEYEGETLGTEGQCVKVATFDSGTREWLEQRQVGIGGSDVGSMLKLGKDGFASANYNEFIESKVSPISDEQVEEQTVTNQFTGATGRGNAWEEVIAGEFKQRNPEFKLLYSKSTWRNTNDPRQVINVDGLLSDREDGVPNGILEIKTASDASKWEKGVPVGYRAQVQWYLDATGYDYAHVAVMIDDREYRSYRIERGETLQGDWAEPGEGKTLDQYRPQINKEWEKIEKLRADKRAEEIKKAKAEREGTEYVAPVKPVRNMKKRFSEADGAQFQKALRYAAAYRRETPEETEQVFHSFRRNGLDTHQAMVATYKSFEPNDGHKDITFVDLETGHGGYRDGDIIEFGATRYSAKGEVKERFSSLYGLQDERILDIKGTGMQDVHNISPDMIRGKRSFRHPESQAEAKRIMEGSVLSYHNDPFENSWMGQHLDGFKDSTGTPPPCVDTMHQAKYMDPVGKRITLESFVTNRGREYVGAHRAGQDAEMSGDAFFDWVRELKSGKFDD